jgi:hypothetical protein
MPTITNEFIEKTIAGSQNNKTGLMVVGSGILACLDNERTWRDTFEDIKKHKLFQRNIKTIADSSHLLVDLNLLGGAGVTQEELNHVYSFFDKIASHLNNQLVELERRQKGVT